MSIEISDEQVQHFIDQGFLIVEGLLSENEVQELEADILALARGRYPCEKLEPLSDDTPDAEALERILCVHQPHFISPVIKRYTAHESLAAVLGQVVGAHLAPGHWDGSVKCMQSMYFVKSPGKPGQAWHQDEIYIPTRDRSLCGAWIAVDDADEENGCLWVLPGSHRRGVLYPQRDHNHPDFDCAQESHGFDDSAEIPVRVKRGGVVFFNGYLLHRSKPNRSQTRYRRALVNHYMSAQSLLPWGLEGRFGEGRDPGLRVANGDNRCVHMVSGEDPQAWKGYQETPDAVYLRRQPAHVEA